MSSPEHLPELQLENIKNIGLPRLAVAAHQLTNARHQATGIEHELPQRAATYGSYTSSLRRLRTASERAGEWGVAAYLIRDGRQVTGMATLQRLDPSPNPRNLADSVEVSYWHADIVERQRAIDYGKAVVGSLIDKRVEVPNGRAMATLWMVTLPEDDVKAAVCTAHDFVPIERRQKYTIGDDVELPRQLWVRQV